MTQAERRKYLITALIKEQPQYSNLVIPEDEQEEKYLLRSLFNIRMPQPVNQKFLEVQDAYLQEEIEQHGITRIEDLQPIQQGIYLWQGDITTLQCDAIVNAANRQMLGCFCPNHGCIDNAIHTFAGVQLRLACAELMKEQKHEETTGSAKITPAFNLPCQYVIHTVGPIVGDCLRKQDEMLLSSCYRSCLQKAQSCQFHTLVFCCIATGEYHFPSLAAAQIAVSTVQKFIAENEMPKKVIFNVFQQRDEQIYQTLLNKQNKF